MTHTKKQNKTKSRPTCWETHKIDHIGNNPSKITAATNPLIITDSK